MKNVIDSPGIREYEEHVDLYGIVLSGDPHIRIKYLGIFFDVDL